MRMLIWKKKKKPYYQFFIILLFINLFIALFCTPIRIVRAESTENTQDVLDETIKEQLENLNLDDLQAYIDAFEKSGNKSVSDRLLEYIKGTEFNYQSFGKEILWILFSKVTEIFPAFACIMAVSLLTGLLAMLQEGQSKPSAIEMVRLIAYTAALIPLVSVLADCVYATVNGIKNMQTQMGIIYPLMMTLMAACGNSVTVAVCRPAVGFFATVISSMIYQIIMPLTLIIMAFSFIGNFTSSLKIGKFTGFFKSVNKWLIGVSVSIFGLFFTLQGITSSSYDGIVRRAAKYAIGNGVPIIGGFLSGGFDLAVAGGVLIKNSLGSMGIFLMIAVLLEPLILLISVSVMLRLTAAITQPMGNGEISSVLGETADNLRYCVACLLFVAFLYFLTILIMICCTESIF